MKRIKHNDLTHYFMTDHKDLPRAYLASCEKFFKSFKRQASSTKLQAPSKKDVDSYKIPDIKDL